MYSPLKSRDLDLQLKASPFMAGRRSAELSREDFVLIKDREQNKPIAESKNKNEQAINFFVSTK